LRRKAANSSGVLPSGESRAERAGQKIDGACGRVGDHDLDRAIGIFGARRRRSGDRKGGKCDGETAH